MQKEISAKQPQSMIGQTVEVLVERLNKDHLRVNGRTRKWEKIIFPGDASLIGTFQTVKIHSYSHDTLIGELFIEDGIRPVDSMLPPENLCLYNN